MSKIFKIIFYSICLFAYSHVMANEEAKYDIVKSNNTYEIRKYSDRLAVQVASTSGNNGFRKLFNYISGNNEKNQKIKMTVPVTVMEKSGNMTMQFYLPSKFDKNNIPNPTGSYVEVLNIEGGYYAVIRYSGRASAIIVLLIVVFWEKITEIVFKKFNIRLNYIVMSAVLIAITIIFLLINDG